MVWIGWYACDVVHFVVQPGPGLSNAAALALVPFDHNIGSAQPCWLPANRYFRLASAAIGAFDSHTMMPVRSF